MKTNLRQPLVAWSHRLPRQYSNVIFLHLLTQRPAIFFTDLQGMMDEEVKGAPEFRTSKYIIKDAAAEGWVEEHVEYGQSHARITEDGVEYMKKTTPVLLAALERSFFVLDLIMEDLYGELPRSVNEVDEIGLESLFDNGGIRNLYRTLFLHTLAHRKEVDAATSELRSPYMFEIMRYLETKHGWRAGTDLFSKVKIEQTKDEHIMATLKLAPVLHKTGVIREQPIETLQLTKAGYDRLQDDLASTRLLLLKTREICLSWKSYLEKI